MPSCVLRVSGADFAVGEFLKDSTFSEPVLHRRGSGFNLEVGPTENDIAGQAREVVEFIRAHRAELARARAFPGVEHLVLNFATVFRDVIVQNETLPATLVAEAGSLGMEIEISMYPPPA